jgi:DNA-binding MarR family transcriptional regulator
MEDTRIEFIFTLYYIGRKIKGHYKKANKDVMLSAGILHLLQKKEYTLSQLAKLLYSKLSSLSEKISAMEAEGLVKKLNKEGDEREQCISLTPAGKSKVAKMLEIMKLHCAEFTAAISNEELVHVNPILKKIVS